MLFVCIFLFKQNNNDLPVWNVHILHALLTCKEKDIIQLFIVITSHSQHTQHEIWLLLFRGSGNRNRARAPSQYLPQAAGRTLTRTLHILSGLCLFTLVVVAQWCYTSLAGKTRVQHDPHLTRQFVFRVLQQRIGRTVSIIVCAWLHAQIASVL